jgi:hypothetical protein
LLDGQNGRSEQQRHSWNFTQIFAVAAFAIRAASPVITAASNIFFMFSLFGYADRMAGIALPASGTR